MGNVYVPLRSNLFLSNTTKQLSKKSVERDKLSLDAAVCAVLGFQMYYLISP